MTLEQAIEVIEHCKRFEATSTKRFTPEQREALMVIGNAFLRREISRERLHQILVGPPTAKGFAS